MKRSVRPSTPADAEAIVVLLKEAGLRPHVEPAHLYWKYWRPRADFSGPRSFLLIEGSRPIAHAALVPGTGLWGTGRVRVVHVIDWAARRSAAGAGAVLMKHIGQQADVLLAIGGSADTLAILPHLGFRGAGTATGYARTLHPIRLLRGMLQHPLSAASRFARGVASALGAPGAAPSGWRARRILAGELEAIAALLPHPARGIDVLGRSADLLAHALACPIAPLQLHVVGKEERGRGYFLLSSVPGQVRIADCWVDSEDPGDWRAMVECAIAVARIDPQAAEIAGWASDPLHASALEACGFHRRLANPVQIRPASAAAMPGAPLRVQMLDNDAAYLHEGRSEFWS